MKIIGGPSSTELAKNLAKILDSPLAKVTTKRFPDGEFYFKFDEKMAGEEVLLVQSLYKPQDAHLMELFVMLHTARDLGAKAIKVFVPYLAYSRQDQRYLEGECLSSAMIAEMLQELSVEGLYTVDIHNEKVLEMYKTPVYNLTAAGELAKYFYSKNLKRPFVVSPDAEEMAAKRAKFAADTIKADCDFFEKKRNRITGDVTTFEKEIDVEGRDAIIIDDIISTGKTAANAANILKKQGARRVFVGVSHALMLGDSKTLLMESGVDELVGTDSVVNEYAKVSVAPILAKVLQDNP